MSHYTCKKCDHYYDDCTCSVNKKENVKEKLSVVGAIIEASKYVSAHGVRRDPVSILTKSMEEMGELATEVGIVHHGFYKQPGKDGIIGEAIDVINCMVDLIYITNPHITEAEILEEANVKLNKWKIKTGTLKV